MKKLILPLMMYKEKGSVKKGTKKASLVVPSWNHLYVIRKTRGKDGKMRLQPVLDDWAMRHKQLLIDTTAQWVEDTGWEKATGRKVYADFWVYWGDAKEKDCHNLDKLPMDAFNDLIYDDDSNALLRFQDFDIDIDNPRIEVLFTLGEFFDRKERAESLRKEKKRQERLRAKEEKERAKLEMLANKNSEKKTTLP